MLIRAGEHPIPRLFYGSPVEDESFVECVVRDSSGQLFHLEKRGHFVAFCGCVCIYPRTDLCEREDTMDKKKYKVNIVEQT